MAALFGTIREFNKDKEPWSRYVDRLNNFTSAVEDDVRKWDILLNVMGTTSYLLLDNLVLLSSPRDKTFKELLEILKKHYGPEPSEIVLCYKFFTSLVPDAILF